MVLQACRCRATRASEIARRIERVAPDAIHIATEGPVGLLARRYCVKCGLPFTSSYTTRFPEYIRARFPIPESVTYAALRRFHAAATVTMVSTPSLMRELTDRRFANLGLWTRGVDTDLFKPERAIDLKLPRPIFAYVGRIAIEKNLEAFLALELPGTKLVIGRGPQDEELRARFPSARFTGELVGTALAAHLAAADVFVFPSRTDTFGIVQLEALASGVPIAAYPVTGPRDVIGDRPIGVMSGNLREACLGALHLSRDACRTFALSHTWEESARQFLAHVSLVVTDAFRQSDGQAAPALRSARSASGNTQADQPIGSTVLSRSR